MGFGATGGPAMPVYEYYCDKCTRDVRVKLCRSQPVNHLTTASTNFTINTRMARVMLTDMIGE